MRVHQPSNFIIQAHLSILANFEHCSASLFTALPPAHHDLVRHLEAVRARLQARSEGGPGGDHRATEPREGLRQELPHRPPSFADEGFGGGVGGARRDEQRQVLYRAQSAAIYGFPSGLPERSARGLKGNRIYLLEEEVV